ncbi:hypothetical protein TNIN_17001, partial [Trichonephila inaurata madagascariensis]
MSGNLSICMFAVHYKIPNVSPLATPFARLAASSKLLMGKNIKR